MSKRVVVLGGGGGIGGVAAAALAQTDDAEEVIVADVSVPAAQKTVDDIGDKRFKAVAVDVTSPESLNSAIAGAAVVVNCVGPFYRLGPMTLAGVIRAGITYVDVCDDLSATRAMLDLDSVAKFAGVHALIGMGNSPGLANVFVKMCAESFLDEIHSVDIMHIHGGEPSEGAAVIKHRIHAMTSDVPVFVDGAFASVRMLEESGAQLVREEEFRGVGRYPVFPYPHPEVITLPSVFPSLRAVMNLGVVFPLQYFTMTQDLVHAGMASDRPLRMHNAEIAPIDVMVALLQRERPRLMAEAGVTGPAGCLKVVVTGTKDGAEHTYVVSVSSPADGAGAGTGIPAAIGAILALRGQLVGGPGVHPPETAVPVQETIQLAGQVVAGLGVAGGAGLPVHLEHISPDGSSEDVPLSVGATG